jgi:hypothetical protein
MEHITAEVVKGSLTIAENRLECAVEGVDLTSLKVTGAEFSDDILTGNDIAKTSVADLGFNTESAGNLGVLDFSIGNLGVEHDVAESLFISLDFEASEKGLGLNVQEGVFGDSKLEARMLAMSPVKGRRLKNETMSVIDRSPFQNHGIQQLLSSCISTDAE